MKYLISIMALLVWLASAHAQTIGEIARDHDQQVTLVNAAAIAVRRAQLIDSVWADTVPGRLPGHLPTTEPNRVDVMFTHVGGVKTGSNPYNGPAGSVSDDLIGRVERIEVISAAFDNKPSNINYAGVQAINRNIADVYFPYGPPNTQPSNDRLVIIGFGHQNVCNYGGMNSQYQIPQVVQDLLLAGYSVYASNQPACGVSADHGNTGGTFANPNYSGMMANVAYGGGNLRPQVMRWFWEAVNETINHYEHVRPFKNYNVAGFSGGGWLASTYSALDPRVLVSIDLSGSSPGWLYASGAYRGDGEQNIPDYYTQASYMDFYIMGLDRPGAFRQQIMNYNDNCCFGSAQHQDNAYTRNACVSAEHPTVPGTCPYLTYVKRFSERLTDWINLYAPEMASRIANPFIDAPAAQNTAIASAGFVQVNCSERGLAAATVHQVSNCGRKVWIDTLDAHGGAPSAPSPISITARTKRRVL